MAQFSRGLLAAGFGGQGILTLGQLVAYTAMNEGRFVTWIPSYGPEMRGGTANCSVVVSDAEIASPVVNHADAVVIMNQPSLEKFEKMVKPGGVLIYNSDLVTYKNPRTDVKVIPVPANSVAAEMGNDKVANVIALGALAEATDLMKPETCLETLKEKLGKKKAQLLELNINAFARGREIARNASR
ncbi:MAG TPA: 2-oxoacid:acceptor oxidoreductase family protein [Synergistaceae bacterium]|nr:2-oxoacid:acceptor oxidoreductase family protein [Synergistaceae bacterium]